MNLIKQHAQEFLRFNELDKHEEFISLVRSKTYDYKRASYKIEFLQHLLTLVKLEYDKHLKDCTWKGNGNCPKNYELESTMFFLNEEVLELNGEIDESDFNLNQKANLSNVINELLAALNRVEVGQRITYDDLSEEIIQLKEYFYLPQKTWIELFLGKITEMIASGIVSETVSKQIVETIGKSYSEIVKNL